MKVLIKLDSKTTKGFYPSTDKPYTEIQRGKMPFNVLSILNDQSITAQIGYTETTINFTLLPKQPELATDAYGYSTTLPILIKSFIRGGLVEQKGRTFGSAKFFITETGKNFLKHNIIDN